MSKSISEVEESIEEKPKRKRKAKHEVTPLEAKVAKDILTYYTDEDQRLALLKFPDKFLKRKSKSVEGFYVATEKTANKISDVLKKDLRSDQTLMEVNPGPGFLTNRLINDTDNDLLLYEPFESFNPSLKASFSSQTDVFDTTKNYQYLILLLLLFLGFIIRSS